MTTPKLTPTQIDALKRMSKNIGGVPIGTNGMRGSTFRALEKVGFAERWYTNAVITPAGRAALEQV